MLLDHRVDAVLFGVLGGVVLEVDNDLGAAHGLGVGAGRHCVGAEAVALTLGGRAVAAEGGPGDDLDLLRHHEDGVEAHAEAADDLGGVGRLGLALLGGALGLLGQLGEEFLGAGAGDDAEVVGKLLGVHAKARVGYGEDLLVLVELDADLEGQVGAGRRFALHLAEAHLVQGVRGVAHELAQKDLFIGVEGVGQDLQDLADLSLEFARFGFAHGFSICLPPRPGLGAA